LTPSKDFSRFIEANLPKGAFNVFHFRLGDNAMFRNKSSSFPQAYAVLKKHAEERDVIIADSGRFKSYIRRHLPLKVTDSTPVHTGLGDEAALRGTISDFILATRAAKLKSYSVYPWTSGFVAAASRLYDVPLQVFRDAEVEPLTQRFRRLLFGR
jgi:hypothetical protein